MPSATRTAVSFRVVRADGGPEMSVPMTGETLTCGTRADLTLPDAVQAWIGRVEAQPGFMNDLERYPANAQAGASVSIYDA